jgi:ubiquinone/menaquinone biosynthesis C-methylase UbiE
LTSLYRLHRLRAKCVTLCPKFVRVWIKERAELAFWHSRHQNEQILRNDHYRFFYTSFFKLNEETYQGCRILDIGCGPRGSLEWANMALERVGLDPLVDRYRALGINNHSMSYCHASVEAIPYSGEHFDRVMSFNSLDHVDNLLRALSEISRVIRFGGMFLLIVEVNHAPTPTEPVEITETELKANLLATYEIASWQAYELRNDHDIYRSLREGVPRESLPVGQTGIIAAKMIKRGTRPSVNNSTPRSVSTIMIQ